jgi:hypothetical protein
MNCRAAYNANLGMPAHRRASWNCARLAYNDRSIRNRWLCSQILKANWRTIASTGTGGRAGIQWKVITPDPVMTGVRCQNIKRLFRTVGRSVGELGRWPRRDAQGRLATEKPNQAPALTYQGSWRAVNSNLIEFANLKIVAYHRKGLEISRPFIQSSVASNRSL